MIHNFETPGILQGLHNLDKSIESFARACFNYAVDLKQDLWFATKDTISKKYDHRFKDIFAEIYEKNTKRNLKLPALNISILSLTMRLQEWFVPMEVISGHAKTMTAT